jgi:hypothetical protein
LCTADGVENRSPASGDRSCTSRPAAPHTAGSTDRGMRFRQAVHISPWPSERLHCGSMTVTVRTMRRLQHDNESVMRFPYRTVRSRSCSVSHCTQWNAAHCKSRRWCAVQTGLALKTWMICERRWKMRPRRHTTTGDIDPVEIRLDVRRAEDRLFDRLDRNRFVGLHHASCSGSSGSAGESVRGSLRMPTRCARTDKATPDRSAGS